MEKMEKQPSLWIHKMKTNESSVVDSIVRLKVKEIYGHVTHGQESVKPFSATADWLARFKRQYYMKNVDFADLADHEAAKEFVKYLLSTIYE